MIIWLDNIDLLWYHYIIAGFIIGTYLHSIHFHHIIHWTIIKILQGITWLFIRTDPMYKMPKRISPKLDKIAHISDCSRDYSKGGVAVSEQDLARMLNNPDISVVER